MSTRRSEIIESAIAAIEAAFADLRLGSGISLLQADAIDNYCSKEEQAAARERDERENWQRIPDEWIMHTPFAMTFMDTAGIMFHLPASMCFALRNYDQVSNCSADSAMDRLTDPEFIANFQTKFTVRQISAIVLFLLAFEELEPTLKPALQSAAQTWQSG